MTKISYHCAEDVYNKLVEDNEANWLLGLVAFANIEEQRIEWIKHQHATKGNAPTSAENQHWYEQITEGMILRATDAAKTRLEGYADDVLVAARYEMYKDIAESVTIKEIRQSNTFWSQFGVNVAGGFVAALLFAILLGLFAFFIVYETSPTQLATEIQSNITQPLTGDMQHEEK